MKHTAVIMLLLGYTGLERKVYRTKAQYFGTGIPHGTGYISGRKTAKTRKQKEELMLVLKQNLVMEV
eukprot:7367446-Heterocapsa_arctica.AAC.1